jgi:helicase MOV-10
MPPRTPCPNFRQDGVCNAENCPHFHPNPSLICELCSVIVTSAKFLESHLKGAKHAAMLKARALQNVPKICTICDTRLIDSATVSAHLHGQRHLARLGQLREQGESVAPQDILILDQNMFECSVCEIQVWQQTKAKHERTQKHKRREQFLSIRRALQDAEKDKHGVSVSPPGDGGFDLGLSESGQASLDFSVKIGDPKLRVVLRSATLSHAARHDSR